MLQDEMQYATPDRRGPELLPDPCSLLPSTLFAAMLSGSTRFALENLLKGGRANNLEIISCNTCYKLIKGLS